MCVGVASLFCAVVMICYHLSEDERAGCFTSFEFMQPYSCQCTVSLTDSAMVWSVVCNCGISLSCILASQRLSQGF